MSCAQGTMWKGLHTNNRSLEVLFASHLEGSATWCGGLKSLELTPDKYIPVCDAKNSVGTIIVIFRIFQSDRMQLSFTRQGFLHCSGCQRSFSFVPDWLQSYPQGRFYVGAWGNCPQISALLSNVTWDTVWRNQSIGIYIGAKRSVLWPSNYAKIRFWPGLRPVPHWRLTQLPQTL